MQNNTDLSKFLKQLDIGNALSVEEDLGNGFVRLKISEAERRQALQDINCVEDVIVELLRNSRDAGSTNVYLGTKKVGDKTRIIHFIDDGEGIPKNLKDLIFEARVTSKLDNGKKDSYGFHGRGMALFSVKLNVREILLTFSGESRGASFYLDIDLDKVNEKKDQSVMPQVIKADGDVNIIGGVNNILKTLIEFQIQHGDINFYYGTPTQVLATMRENAVKKAGKSFYPSFKDWGKLNDFILSNNIKITELPVLTKKYDLLEKISKKFFNMSISQRGIQRIIYNEVKPLDPLKLDLINYTVNDDDTGDKLDNEEEKTDSKRLKLFDEEKLAGRFKDDEIKGIIKPLEKEFNKLGSKYFLELKNSIEYKRINNIIKVIIELTEKEK